MHISCDFIATKLALEFFSFRTDARWDWKSPGRAWVGIVCGTKFLKLGCGQNFSNSCRAVADKKFQPAQDS